MPASIFRSFRSTVTPWVPRNWFTPIRLLVDAVTGSPIGIESPNANGPDGIWTPVDLTSAQLGAPSAAMIADLNATYRLNVAPYTRYQSNGTALVEIAASGAADGSSFPGAVLQTIPPGAALQTVGVDSYAVVYSPLTIQNPLGLLIQGRLDVLTRAA